MMTVRTIASLTVVGATILAVGGCKKDWADRDRTVEQPAPSKEGTTTLTGATVVNNQTAIDRIVAARCAREAACKDVSPDKRVGTQESCTQKLKTEMKNDLNVNECPRGIDQKELTKCLDAIKKEDCNNPIDAISRLAACRTGELCLK
jgi:hypothetical protein